MSFVILRRRIHTVTLYQTVPREMPRHEATIGASRLASRQQRSFAGATVGRPSMTELAPFRLSVRSICTCVLISTLFESMFKDQKFEREVSTHRTPPTPNVAPGQQL